MQVNDSFVDHRGYYDISIRVRRGCQNATICYREFERQTSTTTNTGFKRRKFSVPIDALRRLLDAAEKED